MIGIILCSAAVSMIAQECIGLSKDEKFDVATHILGCYQGKIIEVIDIQNRYVESNGEYAGIKVFEGPEQPDSPYMDMDLHAIFDSLAHFRVKYWNI